MRSKSLGTPSGVLIWCSLSCQDFLALSSARKFALPTLCSFKNLMQLAAVSTLSTRMVSRLLPVAVEIATSYSFAMVPRSPRRPKIPGSAPLALCAIRASMTFPLDRAALALKRCSSNLALRPFTRCEHSASFSASADSFFSSMATCFLASGSSFSSSAFCALSSAIFFSDWSLDRFSCSSRAVSFCSLESIRLSSDCASLSAELFSFTFFFSPMSCVSSGSFSS